LPEGLPQRLIKLLQKVRVGGQMLRLHATDPMPARPRRSPAGSTQSSRPPTRSSDQPNSRPSDRPPSRSASSTSHRRRSSS
jgi:hypothetical protein